MSRFLITFFTVFFFNQYQVSSYWLVKFPIVIDEIREYADSIQRIIEKDSCLLSNVQFLSGNRANIDTTVSQIRLAIEQLTVTSTIQTNIKNRMKFESRDDSERFFRGTGPIYEKYHGILTRLIQLSGEEHDLLAENIHTRINSRKYELECIRLRFIRYKNEPHKSIFHHVINLYRGMDRSVWCDKNDFSWHLSFFNFYYDMIINEFRIFLMDVADYIILLCHARGNIHEFIGTTDRVSVSQRLNRDSVRITINQKKEDLIFNVQQYVNALKWAMTNSRKNTYQCSPQKLRLGETHYEFGNTVISKGPSLQTCDEKDPDSELYEWRHEHYDDYNPDPNDPCPKKVLLKVNFYPAHLHNQFNAICVRGCSEHEHNSDSLRSISLHEQISDIEQNMIVTNVRFVEVHGMIHIQIEQGQLDGSNIYMIKGNRYWEPLPEVRKIFNAADNTIQFHTPGNTNDKKIFLTHGTHYVNIDSNRKTLYLDDVALPAGYVVTGIRFGHHQNSLDGLNPLELQIHGTLYDVEKNELITVLDGKPTSLWITPRVMSSSLPHYQRARTEYQINAAGHPFVVHDIVDSHANQYVNFVRSHWLIRHKHRTVPFFDARPTFLKVQLPLGGVSIFVKGAKGPQPFVTLNIVPYPVSQLFIAKI